MSVIRDPDDVKSYAADQASATDKLLRLLRNIENIADRALGTQPYDEVPCWEHLSSAVGEIEKELALVSAGGNPPAEVAEKKDDGWHPLEIPECGIDFKRYYSPDCEVYICAWQNKDNSIGHVYEIRLRRTDDGWGAVLSNDGRKLCTLSAPRRQLAYRCAIGAMRNYLRRGHRKTTIRRAEKAASALAGARSDAGKAVAE